MKSKPNFWTGSERICWLCVLMAEFLETNSLIYAHLVMSGMGSLLNAPALASARQAIFNMRQMSLDYFTESSVKNAVAIYNDRHYRDRTQGTYIINLENLEFQRTDPLKDPIITKARQILSQPLEQKLYTTRMADPSREMVVALEGQMGGDQLASRLPIGPITAPLAPRRTYSLERSPKPNIRIPLSELQELAVEMDEREEKHPERRPGNWTKRLLRFSLMAPTGKELAEKDYIELEEVKHLIGLPGSGKTTLLVLLAVWLGKRDYKAMFVFPSIEVARQYMAQLTFHQIKVGMLVGQSKETRRRHADNIAEAIAATGNNGGFAYTLEEAETFGMNCVLPAFSNADTSMWGFGYAPCQEILQSSDRKPELKKHLCPVWTMCGRNKAPRDLLDASIWVGHILSMDTQVSPHAIHQQIRYFELIARTFDLVVFDEADMVQSVLDNYGAATLRLSGATDSIHLVIQEQIHNRFARGENYRLFDRTIESYSRDLSEFGDHNTTLITAVQNLSKSSRVGKRYEDQLLTVLKIISALLYELEENTESDRLPEQEVKQENSKNRALTDFWETAAYHAFYDRTSIEPHDRLNVDLCAQRLGINTDRLKQQWEQLIIYFCHYLAENLIERRDKIVKDIAQLFLSLCFPDDTALEKASETITLLVCVTFVILSYQRIIPGTRTMVAEGLIREPIVESTATPELRKLISENILGFFSGVKYSFRTARTTLTSAKNVELSYIAFVSAPRMLMYRFHRLFEAEGQQNGPSILMTSATSFLEASPAYHVNIGPDYLLKPRVTARESQNSVYRFKWIPDRERGDQPLRYSGAGELRDRNLRSMVDELVQGGTTKSELYKSIRNFDRQEGIYRKAAFIVNSYEQARLIKKHIDDYHPEIGKRTKAIVRALKNGEQAKDFVTTAQCEALGDDETCDLIIFPMLAIGRGVNIVFTKGPRKLDAAIGTIYFLTRPHPTTDDMTLLYSLAGKATQEFNNRAFTEADNLPEINAAWQETKKTLWKTAKQLLSQPLMASRLGEDLFKSFTANIMVAILQTIGRGMRNGCPVQVYFVDAAWAKGSTEGKPDTGRYSMLVQMRIILEECINHPEPVIREIYRELYGAFLDPLQRIEGVIFPSSLRSTSALASEEATDAEDEMDDFSPLLEM